MKGFLTVLAFLFAFNINAQVKLSIDTPVVSVDNKTYTLVDVSSNGDVTLKYEEFENNQLIRSGFFYNDKLDGEWILYDNNKVVSSLIYERGNKITHKIINDNETKIIRYLNNRPIRVVTELRLAYND